MRIGGETVDWTMSEVAWLLDNAGRKPLRDICRHLRRSRGSVEGMARRLREQGKPIDLRHFEPRTSICPSCGRASATIRESRSGICEPCRLTRQIEAVESSMAQLMRRLPQRVRATYEATESERDGRAREPMPRMPRHDPRESYYERMKSIENYDITVEKWEVRRLTRILRSAQKRRERMRAQMRKALNEEGGTQCR